MNVGRNKREREGKDIKFIIILLEFHGDWHGGVAVKAAISDPSNSVQFPAALFPI